MTTFYVYLKWAPEGDSGSAEIGRLLLTCASRFVADEFFRALQAARNEKGVHYYTLLTRTTPQFWCYTTIDSYPWWTVTDLLGKALRIEFGTKVMVQILTDLKTEGDRFWPIIPAVNEPDWVNNGAYFIRNKRRPTLYWHHFGGYIYVSATEMTKFRVRAIDFENDDEKGKALIRSDRVEIRPVGRSSPMFVCKQHGSQRVCVSNGEREWSFGALLGGFRLHCGSEEDARSGLLQWTNDGDGDDWELC